jgi:hypothetical protein
MVNGRTFEAPYLWVAVLAMAAGFIGGLTAGRFSVEHPALASEPAKEVEAKAFKLIDDHGATHAALSMSEGGGPALEFYDNDHRARVVFDMTAKGDPRVFLLDEDGLIRTVVGLGLGADGRPFIRLRDKNGKVIWSVPRP